MGEKIIRPVNHTEIVEKIKELAIISLFYDDELMNTFVLKGGNALNIAHKINERASVDIDVSMEDDFAEGTLAEIKAKLQHAFEVTFQEEDYHVFDLNLKPSPARMKDEMKKFWGGYTLYFKVIEKEKFEQYQDDLQKLRQNAIVVGSNQEKTFQIDISKYEFCKAKAPFRLHGYVIYAYTPLMVIYEKLRAICQQMENYRDLVLTNRRPRPRDFFDIHSIMTKWPDPIDVTAPDNLQILSEIFTLKKVPLDFLANIQGEREFHRENFQSVLDTVNAETKKGTYDFYFDYVERLAKNIYEALQEQNLLTTN
ncbi:nucleotidyl transferase AbiEii/AbiGii toxin family protein [Bacillus paranthracis]|uniref:nucleotidyl transferase AbiEii/AbiGii toxin family protein n=1 Tax=Bacillus cereus group TaxID=86661 RepID=UPI0021D2881F|nr:nucleotidyl transferase AbiEii/AbiGii toxin family protein [Bacillus paranthracis]MCU4851563.1 nucleotidyl transferase AbiEii/AbiGii toxin family protein [Bacillus paranthracis]MDA2632935.1 nucleotidyl transferase AbiEii/AbiGii toxin family protein [Bacillus cereus]